MAFMAGVGVLRHAAAAMTRSLGPARLSGTAVVIGAYLVATGAFAAVTTEPAHRTWAYLAAVGYGLSLVAWVVVAIGARDPNSGREWAALTCVVGAVLVPAVVLVVTGSGQPEVEVVRAGAIHWRQTGSPYLDRPMLVDDFRPYLPGTFLFGLLPGVFGDVRVWGLVLTCAALWSVRTLSPRAQRDADVRVGLLLAFPVVALAVAASGIDVPQAALTLLSMSLLAKDRHLSAGAALGLTLAMKPTAICALFVMALHGWRSGDRREAGLFALAALAVGAILVVPVAVADTAGLRTNVVDFPAGAAIVTSPAGSPFPGVLLRMAEAPGWLQTALVAVTAAVVGMWCWQRVAKDPSSAALCIAVCWAAAFAVVPYSRVGYLVLPALVYFPFRFYTSGPNAGRVGARI